MTTTMTGAAPVLVSATAAGGSRGAGRSGHDERLERVRSALIAAETALGVRPVTALRPPAHLPREPEPDWNQAWLPLPPALAELLPEGAVRRGTTLTATGSTAVLLHLLAALAGSEAWTVVVGCPDLGLGAAMAAGLDPARLVLVPDPGPEAAVVLGALVDGFDVLVIGRCRALSAREQRSLSQRVRHRGAVLVSTEPWPEAAAQLQTRERGSAGLAEVGRLTDLTVHVTGSGRAGERARSGWIRLGADGLVAAAAPTSSAGTWRELEAG